MNISKINDAKIFVKIIALSITIGLPFLLLFYFYFIPLMEENLYAEKQENIKENVEIAAGIMEICYKKYEKGEITEDEAKSTAISYINDLRYMGDGYFWINDFDYNMVSHPIKPELNGTDQSNFKDANGKYIYKEFVNIAEESGEGFVDYYWIKTGNNSASPKISYIKSFKKWHWIVGSGIYVDDIDTQLSAIENQLFIALLVILGIVSVMVLFMARNLSVPLKKLEDMAGKVSEGNVDVSVDIDRKDEIGILGSSFNKMVSNLKELLQEVKAKGEAAEIAAETAKEAQALAEEQQEYLARSTNVLLLEMDKFSSGDLTVSVVPEKENDDIAKLFNGFNQAVTNIKDMICQVNGAVEATASASSEISSSAEEMAAGAQEQSAQTTEIAGAVEEMTSTIFETSQNAGDASKSAKEAGELAEEGGDVVKKTVEGMNNIAMVVSEAALTVKELGKNSDQIGEIVQVIDDIADQTNLLALNAAIEAARAGEQGRGFAVVADEVRKLAERTTKATKEIADMIKTIQNDTQGAVVSMEKGTQEVEAGKEMANRAGASLSSIINASTKVVDVIDQVASASEQQSSAAEQIAKNIESISSVTHQSAVGVEQIARASEDLNKLTENLTDLVSRFKISENGVSSDNRIGYSQNYLTN